MAEYAEDRVPAKLQHLAEIVPRDDDLLQCEELLDQLAGSDVAMFSGKIAEAGDIGEEYRYMSQAGSGESPEFTIKTLSGGLHTTT